MRKTKISYYLIPAVLVLIAAATYVFLTLPFNIEITNLTSNGMTITWQTRIPTLSSVKFREENCGNPFSDSSKQFTHHVTYSKCEPNKGYGLNVGSGIVTVQESVVTNELLSDPVVPAPVYATFEKTGIDYADSIVFLNIDGYPTLSSRLNKSGGWTLDLSSLQKNDGSVFNKNDNPNTSLDIWFISGSTFKSQVYSVNIKDLDNFNGKVLK